MKELRDELDEEVGIILGSGFKISVTETDIVPHSEDGAITFPNLDQQEQGTKLIETAVLYVDMRRSTELSLKFRQQTVARLYSAFVRSMAQCARHFNGEVRGIIGDRVLVLFNREKCFENALQTAYLMNSVCQYIINRHFTRDEVTFGIGIDFGRMLATKTGIRRRGVNQGAYRSLVWLGRPANVASKLTDNANKPAEHFDAVKLQVRLNRNGYTWEEDHWPHVFVQQTFRNVLDGRTYVTIPNYESFVTRNEKVETRPATPPILISDAVYRGALKEWPLFAADHFSAVSGIQIAGFNGAIYGADRIFTAFRDGG